MDDERIEEIRLLLPQSLLCDWVRLGSRLVRLLRDQHHAAAHDAVLNRLLAQARASVALRDERRLQVPAVDYPAELPITARKDDIVAAIRDRQVVVIAGETGSGKTTQIPKMCLEAGLGIEGKIGCTQPRRVAALSISRRIAEELNVTWGREVGCKIRFDDRSSDHTYIKMMTDGILLAETQGDPLLSEYNAIIIDEAHERSLNIDFLLGYLKGLLVKRPEMRLIITSATIDTEAFSKSFNDAPIIEVSGRLYPVEVVYAPYDAASEDSGEMTYIDAAVRAAEQVMSEPSGDVLIFMPGERDIRETSELLEGRFGGEAEIIPLFGRLSAGDQQRVFAPAVRRKIIIATNIAETSLTIPGIRYVIDSGLARMSRYNPRTRTKRLPVEPISQSSANQRKGRSGRMENGVCIRLYAEEDFAGRPPYTQPEIQRANLAEVILRMKAFRLGEIETFPFVNPPPPAAIQGGFALLQELGALDSARELTSLGRDLARLPIDPTLGRMLLQSQHEHATRELLIIAAGLSIQDPRDRPLDQKDAATAAHKRFVDPRSDFLTLLNIWNAVHDQWETLRTQNQRRKFCKANFLSYLRMREWQDLHAQLHGALEDLPECDRAGRSNVPIQEGRDEAPPGPPSTSPEDISRTLLPSRVAATGDGRTPKSHRAALRLEESNVAYDAIHRSILSGLLGHVATRTERNIYKGAGNRQLTVFPGSALYDRPEKIKKQSSGQPKNPPKPPSTHQPAWIMAGEIVETSQLFARTVAGIDPLWIVQLAPHLCKFTHHNPQWSADSGRVLAEERTTLYGLEVRSRRVAYGNVNPKHATEIFIRSALIEEALFPDCPEEDTMGEGRGGAKSASRQIRVQSSKFKVQGSASPSRYPFLEHNGRIRQKIETWQTRARRHDLADLDQALFDFYARHIENVSSLDELNRLLRDHSHSAFLCVTEADMTGGQELSFDAAAFPDTVPLGGQPVALAYAYAPGEEQDGVTVKLGFTLAQGLSPASVEWAVPGLREGQISELLRSLPKAIRRELMPFPPKVAEIARDLRPSGQSLQQDLAKFIHQRFGLEIPATAWPRDALPQHLRPRVEIVGNDQKTLGSGRDLGQLREQLEKIQIQPTADSPAWARVSQQWERFGLTGWTFGTLPERITISESGDVPLYAWPGLQVEEGTVSLRLFRSLDAAQLASLGGVQRLVELALAKDLGWLQKDLRALSRFAPLMSGLDSVEELQASAFENLRRHLSPAEAFSTLAEIHFQAAVEHAKQRLPGLAAQLIGHLEIILKLRQELLRRGGQSATPGQLARQGGTAKATPLASPFAKLEVRQPVVAGAKSLLATELQALLPKGFLEQIPFEQLAQVPRYLKALLLRSERAALNPVKDQERARQLVPYREALRNLSSAPPKSATGRRHFEEFRWMVEEFKVSLFAQELGTATPVSVKRLDQQLERMKQT